MHWAEALPVCPLDSAQGSHNTATTGTGTMGVYPSGPLTGKTRNLCNAQEATRCRPEHH